MAPPEAPPRTADNPQRPQKVEYALEYKWWRQLADEVTAEEAKQQQNPEVNGSTSSDDSTSTAFMAVLGGACAISLGAGATVGYRGFEGTDAFHALDKMEKPTVASEAMASRFAMRAFGWGTALAFGTAATVVAACQAMGIKSAADVGACARTYLTPCDDWLQARGGWLIGVGESAGRQLDGLCAGVAQYWHNSWLAGTMRGRVDRINDHHESLELQSEAATRAIPGPASEVKAQ